MIGIVLASEHSVWTDQLAPRNLIVAVVVDNFAESRQRDVLNLAEAGAATCTCLLTVAQRMVLWLH